MEAAGLQNVNQIGSNAVYFNYNVIIVKFIPTSTNQNALIQTARLSNIRTPILPRSVTECVFLCVYVYKYICVCICMYIYKFYELPVGFPENIYKQNLSCSLSYNGIAAALFDFLRQ